MVWDDGDDTLAEPRAPYPHAREVAMLRAHQIRCAALIGGYARTAEAQALVRSGWAHDVVAARSTVRVRTPRVVALDDGGYADERDPAARTARLPSVALRAARSALEAGRRCSSKYRVAATSRRWPAVDVGRLPDAGTAPARCRWTTAAGRLRSAGGAAGPTPRCGAAAAARTPCAPSWWAPGAPPKNWAARSLGQQ